LPLPPPPRSALSPYPTLFRSSHASQRVLAFRAPLVALLMDMELWDASGSTLFDLWARLIAAQQEGPAATFHTAAVLAPLADMGVGSAFAQAHIYGNRMPPADFDGLFQRWFDQPARRGQELGAVPV